MNNIEIKQILKKQAASFNEDVQKKLRYLRGEDVFVSDFYHYDFSALAEDELLSAFLHSSDSKSVFSEVDSRSIGTHDQDAYSVKKQETSLLKREDDYLRRKKQIASRIAALRGTSLPGEYLRKHF